MDRRSIVDRCFIPIPPDFTAREAGFLLFRLDTKGEEAEVSKIKRALISVSDKEGIIDFARKLVEAGVEIVSTGGTAKMMIDEGILVQSVESVTGFPEMMDGRVKTLHPRIHGGILGLRDNSEHVRSAEANSIPWIDMVVVNLYPFEKTALKEDVPLSELIENIDIGGPTLLRSAAKNYRFVVVVTDPSDYPVVIEEIQSAGDVTEATREKLAVKVFQRTAHYNSTIHSVLSRRLTGERSLYLHYQSGEELRYGENSHQKAVFYHDRRCTEPSVAGARLIHGKAMSYNNYVDADAALEAVKDLKEGVGVAVIKHTNPCGYATGETPEEALRRAWEGDPISAFGSVIACNRPVDKSFADFLKGENVKHIAYIIQEGRLIPQTVPGKFVEVVIAPLFTEDALKVLTRSKPLRLLECGNLGEGDKELHTYRKITGGMLEMERDLMMWSDFKGVTRKTFSSGQRALAEFTYKACKHTKSNAIVLGREYKPGFFQVMGMGAGQPNRVDSLRKLAVTKALENLQIEYDASEKDSSFETYCQTAFNRMVLASDAFFPFDDTVRAAAEAGIRYIIQPGGSRRDQDSIDACDELGVAMVFTGLRHFRH
jgi:phosphoribosylaminoimidazolecarboxamide formyltransferase/IMP cyclohydrolase